MSDDRIELDPSRCWVRHVRRTPAGGFQVARVQFAAAELEGVNGRQGWQRATPERRLSDDGSLTISFANSAGEDGTPHVERFALLTNPAYRPGEEWLELYREPHDLLFVGTPVDWRIGRTDLELVCADALVLAANTRASDADYWRGAAPREAFEFYTRGKALAAGADFADGTVPAGWTAAGTSANPAGGLNVPNGSHVNTAVAQPIDPDAWEAEAHGRILTAAEESTLTLKVGGLSFWVNLHTNDTATPALFGQLQHPNFQPGPIQTRVGNRFSLRLVARGEWVHGYFNGELVLSRRRAVPLEAPDFLEVRADFGVDVVLEQLHAISVEPLLARGADRGDHHLPGAPTAGGLRGDYFAQTAEHATAPNVDEYRALCLAPALEPATSRLDATVEFAPVDPPAWQAVATPGGAGFAVRWHGAIRLDLAGADREARVYVGSGDRARLWVGGVLLADLDGGDVAIDTGSLRAHFGAVDGWYPIRLELAHYDGGSGITLQDRNLTAAGGFATVPTERLSPLGSFSQDIRYDSARDVLGQLTETYGFQWRLEPRPLESGLFPGELVPRVRVGRNTDVVIEDLEAQEVGSTGSAADAIDGILVDASGLANADADAPGLTAELLLVELARDHLIVSQGYESLAEISEDALLRQRAASLLALRAAPAETIAARPAGRRGLVQTLIAASTPPGPLQLTGELARMRWEPGDGVRLALEGLRATDTTPRQITSVAWDCRPDGVAPPTVAFRQRPRGIRAVLTRALRGTLAQARANNRR